jgi:hypothetical protein
MKEEDLIAMWDKACVQDYDFFMINFDDKKNKFRQNFNNIFIIKDEHTSERVEGTDDAGLQKCT